MTCVIDPTLLIDRDDYEAIAADRIINKDYILVYCVVENSKLIRWAHEKAKKRGLKLVIVNCRPERHKEPNGSILKLDVGIEEWISLIKYASEIYTSSFHCCIFSIIYKKNFYAVYADAGKSKIVDLLNQLGMNNYCSDVDSVIDDIRINYNQVYNKLEEKRKASLDYLKKTLKY